MDFKVVGKHFIEQDSTLIIDEAGNKLPAKSVMFCKMTPFVIIEEGVINNFTGGKMETVHQVHNQFLEFFEGQVKELQVERSQSIITSVLHALVGTPTTAADAQAMAAPPTQIETAPELLMPVPVAEVPVQPPMVDSQLGGSYITNAQVHNDGSYISTFSLVSEAHDNLKVHFNERLNDKIYSTFKELFNHVKVDSIKEVSPKIDVYNNTIVWYLKYSVALSYTHLEVSEIGHWAETFQVATLSINLQQTQQPIKTNNKKLSRLL